MERDAKLKYVFSPHITYACEDFGYGAPRLPNRKEKTTMVRRVRFCLLEFENGQRFHATFVDENVLRCVFRGTMLRQGMRTSSICNNTSQQGVQTRATGCARLCCYMLR